MKQLGLIVRKLALGLLLLGSTVLLLGASPGEEPQAPSSPESFPSKVVWTPDGKHIIFSRGFEGIYMVDRAGSELRAIPADAPLGSAASPGYALPALSPDGTRLAFVARPSSLAQSAAIMVSALDGTGMRRLTQDEGYNTHPAWSPDGKEIAYIADGKLTVMRADGTNGRVLAPSVQMVNAALAWSPDGSRLAFAGEQQDFVHRAVYTVRPDGTELKNLGPTVSVPSWSPDGSRIAFLEPEDHGNGRLFTLDNTGNDPQSVWSLGRIDVRLPWSLVQTGRWYDSLSWLPDASAVLLASADGFLVVVSLDYLGEMLPGFGALPPIAPNKDFPGGELVRAAGRWAEWSPDGSRIAAIASFYPAGLTSRGHFDELHSMARDGELKRILVQRNVGTLSAKHIGWYDMPRNVAACSAGYLVSHPAKSLELVEDCETLMAVRDRLAGDFLLNWSPAIPLKEWWGVGVFTMSAGESPRVRALYLRGRSRVDNYYSFMATFALAAILRRTHGSDFPLVGLDIGLSGLNGSIPPELGNLSELVRLDLSYNRLRGNIPPELGVLNRLSGLDLSNNVLTGSIPSELAKLSKLRQMDVSQNAIGGSIPPELSNLSKLLHLDLSHNSLTGSIPPEFGNLWRLKELDLSHNGLTGKVAPELGSIPSLKYLNLNGNHLEGCVPQAIYRYLQESYVHSELEPCE